MTLEVDKLLEERGSIYGSFEDNARISQTLCATLLREHEARVARGQYPLMYYQKEALEMIFHKIARILSGAANYEDNWNDIAGYAMLGKDPR